MGVESGCITGSDKGMATELALADVSGIAEGRRKRL